VVGSDENTSLQSVSLVTLSLPVLRPVLSLPVLATLLFVNLAAS
jgi:hypothetical protein